MRILTQRIYDNKPNRAHRVLVDRLWPRGISKEKADLDAWWKELSPSPNLRKWFDHDEKKFSAFRKKYMRELKGHKDEAKELLGSVSKKQIVLLYGAKSEKINHAVVLKEYLESL